jgi:hypothetical protein
MAKDQIINKMLSTKSATLLQIDPRTNGLENIINLRSVCRTVCRFFSLLKSSQISSKVFILARYYVSQLIRQLIFYTGTQWFRLKKVSRIQKNRNFDIRFFNIFYKTCTLVVSENV